MFSWQELKNGDIKSRQKWWLYNAHSLRKLTTVIYNCEHGNLFKKQCCRNVWELGWNTHAPPPIQIPSWTEVNWSCWLGHAVFLHFTVHQAVSSSKMHQHPHTYIYMIMYSYSIFKIHCSYVITSIHVMHIYNLILSFWVVNIIFYALKENMSHQNYCWCLFFLLIIGVCVCVCVVGGVCV